MQHVAGVGSTQPLHEVGQLHAPSRPAVDERTNFANWYSYYRTRMLTMKSATGRAFRTIDDKYRIGYMSINNSAGYRS